MGMCHTSSVRSQKLGNQLAAAAKFRTQLELVTTQVVQAGPFTAGAMLTLPVVLGGTAKFSFLPRLVLLAPDGPPVLRSHDYRPVLCRISVGGRDNRHLSDLGYVVRERQHG